MDLKSCNRQLNRMEKIPAEIEVELDNITLAWTQRWLLFLTAMENILADIDKHNASANITVTNAEDKHRLLRRAYSSEGGDLDLTAS